MSGPERAGPTASKKGASKPGAGSAAKKAGTDGPAGVVLPVNALPDHQQVTTDLEPPTCALAVGAHPDDIEFGCGGTLAKWALAGTAVHYVVLTDGSRGTWDLDEDRATLVARRRWEQQAAARTLAAAGGDVTFLGRMDGELANDDATREALVRCIRTVRPDVVLGHDPWRRYRLHPDHRHAGFLLTDSVVAARDPLFYLEQGLVRHRPQALLLWEADIPNHVEDVSGSIDRKLLALLEHRSQYPTTMGIPAGTELTGPDDPQAAPFVAAVRQTAAEHGALAALEAGEAFHRITEL